MRQWLPALAGALLVVLAAGAYFVIEHRRNLPSQQVDHALDRSLAPLEAFASTPPAGTPCETAYDAFQRLAAAFVSAGRPSPWRSFPDRASFLDRCGKLSPQDQLCLQPRYPAKHPGACQGPADRLFSALGIVPTAKPVAPKPFSPPVLPPPVENQVSQ